MTEGIRRVGVLRGCLPARPVLDLVNEYLDRELRSWRWNNQTGQMHPLDALVGRAGIDRSTLEKKLRHPDKFQWISFEVADRLLCAMNQSHKWLEPPLSDYYLTDYIDWSYLDRVNPLVSETAAA